MESVKNKVVSGGLFHGISNVLQQLFAVAVSVVLARNLGPSAYGIVAIVTAYIGLVTSFTTIGFGLSVIQNKSVTDEQISTLYWLNLLVLLFSWFLVVSSSAAVSRFYNMPELKWIVILLSMDIILSPFYRMQEKLLEKWIMFGRLAAINITSSLVSGASAIVAVYLGLGVYSLVVLALANSFCRMILILLTNRWRPMFYFKPRDVKDMIIFSIKYKVATTVNYFERNVDNLIIGKLFDAFSLGLYSFAYNILYMPVKRFAYVFTQILFPAFSTLQDDIRRMASGYLQSIRLVAIVTFPGMTILSLNAEWIILLLFGEQWKAAIDLVRVLCIAGAIQSVTQLSGVVYHSLGKPEAPIYLGVLKVVMIVAAIFTGSLFGLYYVALLLVAVNIMSFIVNNLFLSKIISVPFGTIVSYLNGPMLSSLVIAMIYYLFTFYQLISNEIVIGVISSVVGLLLLIYVNFDVLRNLFVEVSSIVKRKKLN